MHDRLGEPGERPDSVGDDTDNDTISLPDDVSCSAIECVDPAASPATGDDSQPQVAPGCTTGSPEELPVRLDDGDRVVVLDQVGDSHLTIRYFDEETDGQLERQYRFVRLHSLLLCSSTNTFAHSVWS